MEGERVRDRQAVRSIINDHNTLSPSYLNCSRTLSGRFLVILNLRIADSS